MRGLGNVLLVLTSIPLIAFPLCYHFATHGAWFRSWMGRHLMSFMGALCVVMVFALLNLFMELWSWVRPLTWLLVGAVAWWRLILLFVVQHRDIDD